MPPKLKVRPPKEDPPGVPSGVPPTNDGGASGGVSGGASSGASGGASGGANLAASARGCVGADMSIAETNGAPTQPSIYVSSLSALEQHVCRIAESHLESSFDLSRSTGYLAWKAKNSTA
jgi:hypothetical protein